MLGLRALTLFLYTLLWAGCRLIGVDKKPDLNVASRKLLCSGVLSINVLSLGFFFTGGGIGGGEGTSHGLGGYVLGDEEGLGSKGESHSGSSWVAAVRLCMPATTFLSNWSKA